MQDLKGELLFESDTDRYDESVLSGQTISQFLILPFPSPLLHFSNQSSLFPSVSILPKNPVFSLNFNRIIVTLIILQCSKYWTIWRITILYNSAKTLTSQKYQHKEMRCPRKQCCQVSKLHVFQQIQMLFIQKKITKKSQQDLLLLPWKCHYEILR